MPRPLRIDDVTALAVPEQPALSPDGSRVAYVLRTADAEEDRPVRALWSVATGGGEPRQLTRGQGDSSPAWSPDGASIAFLRAAEGPAQLWLLPGDGGEPEQLTTLPLGAGAPAWSPDGTQIAFAAPTDMQAETGEDDAARARRAKEPIVIDRLSYQADGAGLLRTVRKHVHVLDLETKECRQLTHGDWHAGDPAWSPNGRQLAFAAATSSDADLTYRTPVHVVNADGSGSRPELVALAGGVGGPVTWSPDGSSLLVVGWPGDPVGHAGLWRVPLGGGTPVDLAAPLDRNVMPGGPAYPGAPPLFAGDDRTVLFCVRDRGCTHLYSVSLDGGSPTPLLTGAGRYVSGLSVVGTTAATVLGTATSFGEVATVDLAAGAEETVLTDHGSTLGEIELYPREEREFTVSDGTVVHGWVMHDPAFRGPRPLLVDVHGGPHNAWNGAADEVHVYHHELVSRGWVVLLLNPRGSDGYGNAFFTAALGAWGEADAKDFLEPIDELVAEGLADPGRLAVTGYSYGGFMTCYLTSRDDRFAAGVAGGVVCDLTSQVGAADLGHLLGVYELEGQPWEARERYERLSPYAAVDRVRTPTLVYHGAADVRCPVGQAQQWFQALRARGVPTQLVLYPDAPHLFVLEGLMSHRIDFNRRVAGWVEQHADTLTARPETRLDRTHWDQRLAELAEKHRVPGAALGILRHRPDGEDEVVEAAYGLLNKETGVDVTTDTVFQIGSMTKVWTATILMQLVDEGKLDLDAPIVAVLPEFRVADPEVTKTVTMRHLLAHTSGIDGDIFRDTGRGDDCIEKYVESLADAAQNHPLGATWSYCNSGFSVAGRVIEQLTDGTWDAAIRERLIGPLGMERTGTLPEEALLHRAAVGHIEIEGEIVRAPSAFALPRSAGPAGLVNSTVGDVLKFARLHLTGGLAPDGTRILSEESAVAMTEKQAEVPDKYILGDSWGLGWIRFGWDGRRLLGHDGNTIGQAAFLRVLPDAGLAVTLLTNGGNTRDLYEDLYREIFAELAGVDMPRPLEPPAEPVSVDVSSHLGAYERASVRLDVLQKDDGPVLRTEVRGELAALMPETVQEYPMVGVEEDLFAVRAPETQTWIPVTFYSLPTGERYMHFGARATPKTG
ncbi:MAG TPA: serine hydrolase [Gaiellaceae bacterium]|nr:serine hydrolase [Gaiellaceae bacterium]